MALFVCDRFSVASRRLQKLVTKNATVKSDVGYPPKNLRSDSQRNTSIWHVVPGSMGRNGTNKSTLVAAHAAYWQPLGEHVVLIVVSDAAVLSKKKAWNYTFCCAFYDNRKDFLGISIANFSTRDMVHCPLVKRQQKQFEPVHFRAIPDFVILYRNDSAGFRPDKGDKPKWLLPVMNNYRKLILNNGSADGEFAVCVKILYGEPQWLLMVQFFEYYKSQNVSKFFVKIRSADMKPNIWAILRYYAALDLIDLVSWDLNYKFCPKPDKWCQLTQINECVFRTAWRYRYVAVIDYDELIVSSNQTLPLLPLIKTLDRPERGAFTFAAKYHTTNGSALTWERAKKVIQHGEGSRMLKEHLPLLAWNYSGGVISGAYSPKGLHTN